MTEAYPYGRQMIAAAAAAIKVGVTTANLDEGSWILFGGSLRTGPCDSSHPRTGSKSDLKAIHTKLSHRAAPQLTSKGRKRVKNINK